MLEYFVDNWANYWYYEKEKQKNLTILRSARQNV